MEKLVFKNTHILPWKVEFYNLSLEDNVDGVSNEEILSILSRMIKQRQESAKLYEEAGRLELAQQEFSEIKIIETFLPRQLDNTETEEIVKNAISELKASSLRDMGKVMNVLKESYSGKMDFGKAGAIAKDVLSK